MEPESSSPPGRVLYPLTVTAPARPTVRLAALREALARLAPEPAIEQLERIGALFAGLEGPDVELARHAAPLAHRRDPGDWWSVPLLALPGAHLSLFLLPAGAVIPCHDHPGMRVWSRVLRGRVRVRSWDWIAPPAPGEPAPAWASARPADERALSAGAPPLALDPVRGNLHELRAELPSALLDLFAPPYEPDGARRCHYWAAQAAGPDGVARLRLLREA